MFCEYIQAAMSKAAFEVIDDEEPYYGEVPELKGVWGNGKDSGGMSREPSYGYRGLDSL